MPHKCVASCSAIASISPASENGQHLEVRTLVTLYEARGDFQLNAELRERRVLAICMNSFCGSRRSLSVKDFDSAVKRPLPVFPRCIGIVTSLQAAAMRDVLTTLERRAPHVHVVLYTTPVQGEGRIAADRQRHSLGR